MAKENDTPEDDNIFGEDRHSELDDMLNKMMDEIEENEEEDTGGLNQPIENMPTVEVELVDEKKAREILSDAELGKTKKAETKPDAKAEAGDDPNPEGDTTGSDDVKSPDKPEEKPTADTETGEDGTPTLASAPVADLLEGVPDDRRAEISRRLAESETALSPFSTPYAKEQLAQFGGTPKDMASRLVELATFASEKPDEYLAWAAQNIAKSPDKIGDVLDAAAKLHGYKVVKVDAGDDDDDDLFADPEILKKDQRIKELEAQLKGGQPTFGPDTPERQQQRRVQRELNTFINERDESGNLKRPLFEKLQPQIVQRATAARSEGKTVTTADLDVFYAEAAEEIRTALTSGTPTTGGSAAQVQPGVAEQIQKQKADAANKARRASKTLDGVGQSTARQPAIPRNAPLDQVIGQFWDDLTG